MSIPSKEDLALFQQQIDENRFDFCRLVYIIFPFGEPGHELEHMKPYDWQMEEWRALSAHLMNPATRYELYQLIVSSGNGAAKTAFGAMTVLMLMYTQQLRGRITANTDPQMKTVIWPEYDIWFHRARFGNLFFEKLGTSIKAKDEKVSESWRFDTITWSEETPTAISGLHNYGKAVMYVFEEGPGIPSNIWQYAKGAFTELNTIKIHFAFGNSDDPESQFEQNMISPLWRSRRIDTRTLKHIDKNLIAQWLHEAGGNEDHDDFRVRVRGLPRKSAKDSIISLEHVLAAIARRKSFDKEAQKFLPCIYATDPAWTGGDETTIWFRQGHYTCLLDKFKLDKTKGQDHSFTYNRILHFESLLQSPADAANIDQAEGTSLFTLANMFGRENWQLISFSSTPGDAAEFKDSQYANKRAEMYYEAEKFLREGGVIDSLNPEWLEVIQKQLCWTKGTRHKTNLKKLAEPKVDIKDRVGQSPDVADGFVLLFARPVLEKLPENDHTGSDRTIGGAAFKMPEHGNPYEYEGDSEIYD